MLLNQSARSSATLFITLETMTDLFSHFKKGNAFRNTVDQLFTMKMCISCVCVATHSAIGIIFSCICIILLYLFLLFLTLFPFLLNR